MSNPNVLRVTAATITPANRSVPLFPSVPAAHPALTIDSIGATILGGDLSQILSASLVYFSLDSDNNLVEVLFPISGTYRSMPGTEIVTITHALNCYLAANTFAALSVDWLGDVPAGTQAQVDLVCTYH